MIRRRAAAGIMASIGNHTFRATGITAYLGNGGAPRKPWPRMKALAQPSFMTARRTGSRRTRWRVG
jgi:hypothetical protein